jgi:hypothetical protein
LRGSIDQNRRFPVNRELSYMLNLIIEYQKFVLAPITFINISSVSLSQTTNGYISILPIPYLNIPFLLRFCELLNSRYLSLPDSTSQAQVEVVIRASVALTSLILPVSSHSTLALQMSRVAGPAMSVGAASLHFALVAIKVHLVLHNFGPDESTEVANIEAALLAVVGQFVLLQLVFIAGVAVRVGVGWIRQSCTSDGAHLVATALALDVEIYAVSRFEMLDFIFFINQ